MGLSDRKDIQEKKSKFTGLYGGYGAVENRNEGRP